MTTTTTIKEREYTYEKKKDGIKKEGKNETKK